MDVEQVVRIRWQGDSPSEEAVQAAFLEAGAMNPAVNDLDGDDVEVTFEYNEEPGFSPIDVAKRAAESLGPVQSVESINSSDTEP